MSDSIRGTIPALVRFLLREHAAEWSSGSRGLISYQLRKGQGGYVIFRTPRLKRRRLVSARILARCPSAESDWLAIRRTMVRRGPTSLTDAKHRYLVVPRRYLDRARKTMAGTKVRVLAIEELSLRLDRRAGGGAGSSPRGRAR
jgi:hypothetical protein